jgi:3-dehydroquinate dehydratase-2
MASGEKGFEDVIPTVTLAKLYERQGLLEDAASVYRKLLSIEPGQKALEEALDNIEKRRQGSKPRAKSGEAEAVLSQLEKWERAVCLQKRFLEKREVAKARLLVICGPVIESSSPSERMANPDNAISDDIDTHIKRAAEESAMLADVFWASNEEGMIQRLRGAAEGYDVLIIDPGQPACTGPDTRDALATLDIPIIEVHPLNAFCGDFSHKSGIADVTTAHLAGFGKEGYAMAVRAAALMARQSFEAKALAVKNET